MALVAYTTLNHSLARSNSLVQVVTDIGKYVCYCILDRPVAGGVVVVGVGWGGGWGGGEEGRTTPPQLPIPKILFHPLA